MTARPNRCQLAPSLFRAAVAAAADVWGVAPEDLLSRSYVRPILQARQTAMLLCREHAAGGTPSLHSIGRAFGRDHSTVLYSITQAAAFEGADRERRDAAAAALWTRVTLSAGEGRVEIRVGDAFGQLRAMPDESVDCIVTSPPYWGLRDYGVAGQIGLEASLEAHEAILVAVFEEARRVLRPHGTLWMNYGDAYASSVNGRPAAEVEGDDRAFRDKPVDTTKASGLPAKNLLMLPARVALALQKAGWILRSEIIWAKPNPMPESARDRPAQAHEKIFLFAKQQRYFYDAHAVREPVTGGAHPRRADGERLPAKGEAGTFNRRIGYMGDDHDDDTRACRNVWTIATQAYPGAHFATFPTALAERCIKAGTSQHGCCSKCGAPWVREVERVETGATQKRADGWASHPGAHGSTHRDGREAGKPAQPVTRAQTVGWAPSCRCAAPRRPAVVLDPFGGAGTTGLVAARLGRRAILLELNPDYAAGAQRRIDADWKGPDERAGFLAEQDDAPPPLFAAAGITGPAA